METSSDQNSNVILDALIQMPWLCPPQIFDGVTARRKEFADLFSGSTKETVSFDGDYPGADGHITQDTNLSALTIQFQNIARGEV